jgi:methylglyoxal synthase
MKNIAIVAHDNKKSDLIEWARWNYRILTQHRLICTGTTGRLIEESLLAELRREPKAQGKLPGENSEVSLDLVKLRSGPLGGDQQLGAMIAEDKIDFLIFFWDPMEPHPHDVDVKALLRIAVVYNVPTACNRSTADFIITSPLMDQDYRKVAPDFAKYIKRDTGKLRAINLDEE